MSSLDVESVPPEQGDPPASRRVQNSIANNLNIFSRDFESLRPACAEGAHNVGEASGEPLSSQIASRKEKEIPDISSTSQLASISAKPAPCEDPDKTLSPPLDRTINCLRDLSTTTNTNEVEITSSPLLYPFASPHASSPIRRSLAARRQAEQPWLHQMILRAGGVTAWASTHSTQSSPLFSARTPASAYSTSTSLILGTPGTSPNPSTTAGSGPGTSAGMGTSSGSESDGSIGAVVAEHAKHLDDMRLLVDEAGLLTSALKLAEKERDVALRQRGALEDALKKIKVENKDVRRKVKELETAVAERDQRYKIRKSQFHSARRQHQEATKHLEGARKAGSLWKNAFDKEVELSRMLQAELDELKMRVGEKDERLVAQEAAIAEKENMLDEKERALVDLHLRLNEETEVLRSLLEEADTKYNEAEATIEQLSGDLAVVLREREELRDALRAEHRSRSTEREALIAERDEALEERAALSVERDVLVVERDSATAERASLSRRIVELSKEGEAFQSERDAWSREREEFAKEREAWKEERARFEQERTALVKSFDEERSALTKSFDDERISLTSSLADLRSSNSDKDALVQQVAQLASERDALVAAQETMSAERDAALEERDTLLLQRHTLMAERDSMDTYIKQLSEEVKSSKLDLSIAKDKASFLTNKNSELLDTVSSLRIQIERLPNDDEASLLDKNASLRDKNAELRLHVDRLETEIQRWQRKAKDYKEHVKDLQVENEEIINEYNAARERKEYYKNRFEEAVKINAKLREKVKAAEEHEEEIERIRVEATDAITRAELLAENIHELETLLDYAREKGYIDDEITPFDLFTEDGEEEDEVYDEEYASDEMYEDADLEGLDLDGLDEGIAAVNEDGEIVDTHPPYLFMPRSPADIPLPPSEPSSPEAQEHVFQEEDSFNPLDPGGWITEWAHQVHAYRLEEWDAVDQEHRDRDARFHQFERLREYHEAMEALRLERDRLNDYRLELIEFKAEINEEKIENQKREMELRKREMDMNTREAAYWNENDERVQELNRLAEQYDVWKATCEVKEAEINEASLGVWRQRRELDKRLERIIQREKMCRKREGEVRWRMACIDGALANVEQGCWRCVPAPAHLIPPTPPIDFRSLDEHFDQIDDGAHESQRLWAEERNRRLREEREARCQDNLDEEYLQESEDEPFEFSGPAAVQRYLRDEKRHLEDMKADEEVDEEAEEEEWQVYKEQDDERVREIVEAALREADDERGARKAHKLAVERGVDNINGIYDEALAIDDGLHGMGLIFDQPIASTSAEADGDITVRPSDDASSTLQHSQTDSSPTAPSSVPLEAPLADLIDPESRSVLLDLTSVKSIGALDDTVEIEPARRDVSEWGDATSVVEEESEVAEALLGNNGAEDTVAELMEQDDYQTSIAIERSLMAEGPTRVESLSASWEDVVPGQCS